MKVFQILISSITTFFIVGGGAMGAVLVALSGQRISPTAIAVCVLTGLVAAMKDIRSTMSLPPLSNGNYEAIGRFMRATGPEEFATLKSHQADTDAIRSATVTPETKGTP